MLKICARLGAVTTLVVVPLGAVLFFTRNIEDGQELGLGQGSARKPDRARLLIWEAVSAAPAAPVNCAPRRDFKLDQPTEIERDRELVECIRLDGGREHAGHLSAARQGPKGGDLVAGEVIGIVALGQVERLARLHVKTCVANTALIAAQAVGEVLGVRSVA